MIVNADIRSAEAIKRLIGIDYPSVAEIGCFKGDMSRRLLYRLGLHLMMVDPWGGIESSEEYLASGDPMASMTKDEWQKVMHEAYNNVQWAEDRVRVFQGSSVQAANELDERFDMVFIDGDHSYKATSEDIEAWWPKLAGGGWLGGHDYRTDKNFGVIQAVNEFAEENDLELELGGNYTWWIHKNG